MASEERLHAIEAVSLKGFKSFADQQRIELRPLTVLAGANSSGKSSAFQPLLLLKQTLEARYDPGPILLDGPNVRVTSASQVLARLPGGEQSREFTVSLDVESAGTLASTFAESGHGFDLVRMATKLWEFEPGEEFILEPSMREGDLLERGLLSPMRMEELFGDSVRYTSVKRYRCFLDIVVEASLHGLLPVVDVSFWGASVLDRFSMPLVDMIHIPGLRGNPERSYRSTAVGTRFSGTFDNYVASVISAWAGDGREELRLLGADLGLLGLSSVIRANVLNASQIELLVNRTSRTTDDLVNIADVGLGVSQALPVLVALRVAQPGQLVYIEQPELHLHPRAQKAMASVLAEAVRRGVRIVTETHSSILLLAIQSLVAEGDLDPSLVMLHWFQRDEHGATHVSSTDLDENGAYGDWPEDFGEVRAEVENRYLNAVEARAFSRPAAKRARTKKK